MVISVSRSAATFATARTLWNLLKRKSLSGSLKELPNGKAAKRPGSTNKLPCIDLVVVTISRFYQFDFVVLFFIPVFEKQHYFNYSIILRTQFSITCTLDAATLICILEHKIQKRALFAWTSVGLIKSLVTKNRS